MLEETLDDAKERMNSSVSVFQDSLNGLRTAQASPALVDRMQVETDAGTMMMNQVGQIGIEDQRTLVIRAYYDAVVQPITRAIQMSDIGVNPNVDGLTVRIVMPDLTQERRQELVRIARRRAEEARVAIRNVRRDAQSMIRELQNDGEESEDDCKRASRTLQEITDEAVAAVAERLNTKEEQITQ